jgi:hypothetical protein
MPYKEGGIYLHAAPIFHILDFLHVRGPAFGNPARSQFQNSARGLFEAVQREGDPFGVGDDVINLLVQFEDLKNYDLHSLELLAYGGRLPELVRREHRNFSKCQTRPGYGLRKQGFHRSAETNLLTKDLCLRTNVYRRRFASGRRIRAAR